jgi:hypothetical protein
VDPALAFKEVTRRTGALLRNRNFKGSGQNFKRPIGEQWQGLNFQKSQWRGEAAEPVHFYINVCLHFPSVQGRPPGPPVPATFAEFSPMKADLRLRLGELLPDGDDEWLVVGGEGLEEFWARLGPTLDEVVAPAMDRMATREGMEAIIRRVPWSACPMTRAWLGPAHAPPPWDPDAARAGQWIQDGDGLWWGPGERAVGRPA